jgi:hypothetical protein
VLVPVLARFKGRFVRISIAAIAIVTPAFFGVFMGCSAIASIANEGASFGGATADVHCDRRFTTDGGQRSAFCQELVATVAASQFSDDCRNKFQASAGPGLCPRDQIIAGCELDDQHKDGSHAWDWYYDVSSFIADAGPNAGVDGGPTFADPVATNVSDVAKICADPTRYNDGAELVSP